MSIQQYLKFVQGLMSLQDLRYLIVVVVCKDILRTNVDLKPNTSSYADHSGKDCWGSDDKRTNRTFKSNQSIDRRHGDF